MIRALRRYFRDHVSREKIAGRLKSTAIDVAFTAYNLTARRLPAHENLPGNPFDAMNRFFDAIWVLTIARNGERQNAIRRQFQGLDFQFYDGVEGRFLLRIDPRLDSSKSLKMNEFACALSHLGMYQKMIDSGLQKVLILEDDAVFLERRSGWLSYCLARLPVDWELFYFGYHDGELRGFQREFQELFGRLRDPRDVVARGVGRGIRTAARHDCTYAYAVTNAGARKLLEGVYPVRYTADGWLEHKIGAGAIRGYASVPKLFLHYSSTGSSIHAE